MMRGDLENSASLVTSRLVSGFVMIHVDARIRQETVLWVVDRYLGPDWMIMGKINRGNIETLR